MNLRVASFSDSAFLHRLRNDPETRDMSRTDQPISREDHDQWLAQTTDRIFIAEVDGVSVGTVRLVRHPHELEMGIVIAPEHRGKDYAATMIKLGAQEAWRPVVAYVREDNERSLRAFRKAGFKQDDLYVRFTSDGTR